MPSVAAPTRDVSLTGSTLLDRVSDKTVSTTHRERHQSKVSKEFKHNRTMFVATSSASNAEDATMLQWGTWSSDVGNAVAQVTNFWRSGTGEVRVSQNTVVAGTTSGDLVQSNAGKTDAFLRLIDPNGNELWSRQWGTAGAQVATAVVAAALPASSHASARSEFTTKTSSGNSINLQHLRPDSNGDMNIAYTGSRHIFVTGYTDDEPVEGRQGHTDMFLAAFDGLAGNMLWMSTHHDEQPCTAL